MASRAQSETRESRPPRTLTKKNPDDEDSSRNVVNIDLVSQQSGADTQRAARRFKNHYDSLMALKTSIKTHNIYEGLDRYCNAAASEISLREAAGEILAQIRDRSPKDARGDAQAKIQDIDTVLDELTRALDYMAVLVDEQVLLSDLNGSAAVSERAAIGRWLGDNFETLQTMRKLLTWRDDLVAKRRKGDISLDCPDKVTVLFSRHPNEWKDPSGLQRIKKLFSSKSLAESDRKMLEAGDETVTAVVDSFLEHPDTSWGKITSLSARFCDSLIAVTSTAKNVLQSFGARYVPTLDVMDLLWFSHEPNNAGSILSQIQLRSRGVIPEEWGWEDPTVTINLDELEDLSQLVRIFETEQAERSSKRSGYQDRLTQQRGQR